MKYIALLRGINVGGHTVKMERLRELFSELGFQRVRTFIQTGNVFFETDDKDRKDLQQKIEGYLIIALGYSVPTFLLTLNELEEIIRNAPFKNVELTPETRHMIVFLSEPLPEDLTIPLKSPHGDFVILKASDNVAYMLLTLLDGRPTNTDLFFKKIKNIKITSRFYHTTQKILEAAELE
jgi:uncharacterized protein (DUF1697 family)